MNAIAIEDNAEQIDIDDYESILALLKKHRVFSTELDREALEKLIAELWKLAKGMK